jgi:hypothetical protein
MALKKQNRQGYRGKFFFLLTMNESFYLDIIFVEILAKLTARSRTRITRAFNLFDTGKLQKIENK